MQHVNLVYLNDARLKAIEERLEMPVLSMPNNIVEHEQVEEYEYVDVCDRGVMTIAHGDDWNY